MKTNPETMSWTAPTTNVDGTEIDYELEYEVGVYTEDAQDFEPVVTMPGQLQIDGRYTAPIAMLSLVEGEQTIALRSFAKDQPELKSEWSQSVTFVVAAVPSAPLELRVT